MIEYNISVCFADEAPITESIEQLIRDACEEANGRTNAIRKGRRFLYKGLIDDTHFHLTLLSDSEVIPSRALSAFTRSILDIDTNNVIRPHIVRNSFFQLKEISPSVTIKTTTITPVALLQTLTDIIFGQDKMSSVNKSLAKDTYEIIEKEIIEYLNKKSII